MPHDISLITTIAASLGLATLLGYAAARLRMPPMLGYLLAGIVLGPATPGFDADLVIAGQLAEIGIMLMMFGVGLHFSIKDLMEVKRIAIPGAMVQIAVATAMGTAAGHAFGWPLLGSAVFGLSLSVASTVVLLRALEARGLLDSHNGRIAVGWLVVEDLVMVLALVLLPHLGGLFGTDEGQSTEALGPALALTTVKIVAFIALMLVVGKRVLPKLLWLVGRTGSRELFTLCVIAIALGVAFLAATLFDVSFALGAFFAGMMMRESELSHRAAEESLPLRDAFAVLFFVSVGMLLDPATLLNQPTEIALVVAIIVFGKTAAAILIVRLFGYPLNTSLTVGASLAQIGEFSFILCALAVSEGLLPTAAQQLVVAGALMSIALNPLLFAAIEPLQRWIRSHSSLARVMEQRSDPLAELPTSTDPTLLTDQVVIVGHGRVGRRLADTLQTAGIPFVVADQNRERVEALRARGLPAVFGDATEPATLIQAHVARAAMLVIALPDSVDARKMVEVAKLLNPKIRCVVRTHSEDEAELLRSERVGDIFMGEQELARNIGAHVLEQMQAHAASRA
ncbi:MAG TPA: YbaL family putative K(+) efflux transporter [Patescibacteria group bacterium]|nr:YbaL family putative K(+) efflux transporter [Patescibacteria group bacterium]